jgi:hypothetical protein
VNIIPLLVAALVAIPALGLLLWGWMAMESATEELGSFVNFEGMHFED